MNRAYSVLTIKKIDEDARIIEGIATTPSPDRVGDIVEPEGAEFKLPIPLLWQHNSSQPIGHVIEAKVSKEGIWVRCQLVKIEDAGVLKDRLDEAWQSIKSGLVRGFSIGFKELEFSRIGDTYAYRFLKWLWLELSAVTIPANEEATITNLKKFDTGAPAATGPEGAPTVPISPGASGRTIKSVNLRPKEGNKMNIAEMIAQAKAARAEKDARRQEIQKKCSTEGRTKDAAEREEFDTLSDEIAQLDAEIKDLDLLEKSAVQSAKPAAGDSAASAAASRGSAAVSVKTGFPKAPPGVRFARIAKVKMAAKLDQENVVEVARRLYGESSEVFHIVSKGAVAAGTTATGNWAANLVGEETSAYADFAAFLRPATILGKFGEGAVPSLRQVPFREPLIAQTGGGQGYWVGEAKPKPLTSFGFDRSTLEPLKVANIAVLSEENIRSSSPSSEMIVRDALRDALVAVQDVSFIDPTNTGQANVKAAAITYGAPSVASTGTDADAIRLDVRALFQKFILADNPPEQGVWIMSTTNALSLSLMVNALGQREFPGITMTGGTFEGLPVIASRYAGNYVALVNASDIYEADDGEVAIDMSREASLEMLDASLVQDPTAGTGTNLVSLWQNNLVGIRAERTINWKRRRDSAVSYLTGVVWGGAVPAS